MKILCIMTTIGYSGAPKMMSFLANSLCASGYDTSLLTFYSDEDHQVLNEGINRVALNISRPQNIFQNIFNHVKIQAGIFKCVKQRKPDVVICFSNLPSGVFLFLHRFVKAKIIISERGDPYLEQTRAMNWLRSQYKKADGVVFQTEGAKKYFSRTKLRNPAIIPNPVTQTPIQQVNLQDRTNDIAFVGRFNIRQKRQDVYLQAFKETLKFYPFLTTTFYGEGEDMDKVKTLAEELGLINNVRFAGQVDNICKVISPSKMFVITSDFEGIPNSLIDAMLSGLPIVATDCSPGGAALLINNGENGLLVPCGDIKAISAAMCNILEDPERAQKMGKQAQNVAVRFSPNVIIRSWIEEIEKVSR